MAHRRLCGYQAIAMHSRGSPLLQICVSPTDGVISTRSRILICLIAPPSYCLNTNDMVSVSSFPPLLFVPEGMRRAVVCGTHGPDPRVVHLWPEGSRLGQADMISSTGLVTADQVRFPAWQSGLCRGHVDGSPARRLDRLPRLNLRGSGPAALFETRATAHVRHIQARAVNDS